MTYNAHEAVAAIESKGVEQPCPVCPHGLMAVENSGYATIQLTTEPGVSISGGVTASLAAVVRFCAHCGYVQLFNAKTLGMFG